MGSSQVEKPIFEIFPVCSGCVSLLISHPGWGPVTAELKTKAIEELSRALDFKNLARKALSKTNNLYWIQYKQEYTGYSISGLYGKDANRTLIC